MKMKIVYEANSSLGNPMTVEGQLNESEHKLEKLKLDLKKYQGYLDKASQAQVATSSPQANRNQLQNGHRTSRYLRLYLNRNTRTKGRSLYLADIPMAAPMTIMMMATTSPMTLAA